MAMPCVKGKFMRMPLEMVAYLVKNMVPNVTFGSMYFIKYATISRGMGINLTLTQGMDMNLSR